MMVLIALYQSPFCLFVCSSSPPVNRPFQHKIPDPTHSQRTHIRHQKQFALGRTLFRNDLQGQ